MRRWFDKIACGFAFWHAQRVFRRFMGEVQDGRRCQERLLGRLLRLRAESELGRRLGFGGLNSVEQFRRQVPIHRYDDLAEFIERVKRGQITAMFAPRERVHMFALTSGATAEPKFIPVTDEFLRTYRRGWNVWGVKAFCDHPDAVLRYILQVVSPMDESHTSAGIPCGAITGLMARFQKRLVRRYYVATLPTAYIKDSDARYYTLMRLAVPRDVALMVTANPATQLRLARCAELHAERLIRDVRDGTLTPPGQIESGVHQQLQGPLRPDPPAAKRLQHILDRTGRLRPKDYWNLSFIANWMGGTLSLYLRDFPEWFGQIPVRDIGLLASEGRVCIPLADGTPAGVLDVQAAFFEFIPAEDYETARPTTRLPHELEVGQKAFVVITNAAGLVRYDLGDCVRVVDRLAGVPVVEFLHRGLRVCSMAGEKLTEKQVVQAIEQLTGQRGLHATSFVLLPRWGQPPFYQLRIELASCPLAQDELAEAADQALQQCNLEYASKRASGRLGSIQLQTVAAGYFAELDQQLSAKAGGRNEQYKHQFLYVQPDEDPDPQMQPARVR